MARAFRLCQPHLMMLSPCLSKGGWGGYIPFYFGETITGELANYNATSTYADEQKGKYRRETTLVGQFLANAFGLFDMHGNVLEWCADNWHDNYQDAPTDGSAWIEGGNENYSPLRGGSWYSNPRLCRSAFRYTPRRDIFNHVWGFRVCCDSDRMNCHYIKSG